MWVQLHCSQNGRDRHRKIAATANFSWTTGSLWTLLQARDDFRVAVPPIYGATASIVQPATIVSTRAIAWHCWLAVCRILRAARARRMSALSENLAVAPCLTTI